jgi:hypothetical protein
VTEHPGEQFPPAVDPDVEPAFEPQPDEESHPDYDSEPEPEPESHHTSVPRPGAWIRPAATQRPTSPSAETSDGQYGGEVGSPAPSFKPGPPTTYQAPRPGPSYQAAPAASAHEAAPAPPYPEDARESADSAYQDDSEYREEGAHPLVEETMARLEGLRERPVAEHAEVYADLHERLQSALVEADADDRG